MTLAEQLPWFPTASRSARWLVGVSGGADSVALLHLLVGSGFSDVIACHLHHGLRGSAATEDADFVRRLAKDLGVKCEIGDADVAGRIRDRSESLETAARHARHDFFAVCAGKHACSNVLLAHHADDQAETVLWNLLRGSHGLRGMELSKQIVTEAGVTLALVRPLLGVRHTELVDYLQSRGLQWREDATNAEPVAIRNRLRNEALPLLAGISGRDVVAVLARAADATREHQSMEAWALGQAQVLDPQGRLHVPALRNLPVALQRAAIRKFLRDCGISSLDRALIDRCIALLDPQNPAVVNLPEAARLRRREGRLWVET